MELREGNAGQAVGPHKIHLNLQKGVDSGRWKTEDLGEIPSYGNNKKPPRPGPIGGGWAASCPPGLQGPLEVINDPGPGSSDRGSEGGADVKSKDFDTSGHLHPQQRPVLRPSPGPEAKNY